MKLLYALENYPALRSRVPSRHWGGDETTSKQISIHVCGYCAKGRTCTHADGTNLAGLKPIPGNRLPDVNRLDELLADIDRQIDMMFPTPRALFHLRYRIGHPIEAVMQALGISALSDYMAAHDWAFTVMEIRLIDWFEPDEPQRFEPAPLSDDDLEDDDDGLPE